MQILLSFCLFVLSLLITHLVEVVSGGAVEVLVLVVLQHPGGELARLLVVGHWSQERTASVVITHVRTFAVPPSHHLFNR